MDYCVISASVFNFLMYSVVLACQAGSYGENCHLTCECGESPCDPVSGQCICPAGKTGHACQEGTFILLHCPLIY